jgi:hypothetical protein
MKRQLIKYVRDNKPSSGSKGSPKGVIVSFIEEINGEAKCYIGWSLCSKADAWNKDFGLKVAVNRAYFYGDNPDRPYRVAQSVSKEFINMIGRSKKFFKDVEFPTNIKTLAQVC